MCHTTSNELIYTVTSLRLEKLVKLLFAVDFGVMQNNMRSNIHYKCFNLSLGRLCITLSAAQMHSWTASKVTNSGNGKYNRLMSLESLALKFLRFLEPHNFGKLCWK